MKTDLGYNRFLNLALAAGAVYLVGANAVNAGPRYAQPRAPQAARSANSDAICRERITGQADPNLVSFGGSCGGNDITMHPMFNFNPATTRLGVGTAAPLATTHSALGVPGIALRGQNTTSAPTPGNATGIRADTNSPLYCPADEIASFFCDVSGAQCAVDADCPPGEFCSDFGCPTGGAGTAPNVSFAIRGRAFAEYGAGGVFGSNAANVGVWIDTEGFGVGGTGKYLGAVIGTNGSDCDTFQPFPLSAGLYTLNNQAGGSQTFVGLWAGTDQACLTGTDYKILGPGVVSTVIRDGDRGAVLFAPEAPEPLFQDYGQGRLVNGFAHINLDPLLASSIAINARHPLRVFIQLEDNENCLGVVVKNKTTTGFDVVELGGGRSNTPFQYSVTANRANEERQGGITSLYEDLRFPTAPKTRPVLLPAGE